MPVRRIVLERQVKRGGDFDADVEHVQFLQQAQFLDARVQAAVIGQLHHEILLALPFIEGVNVDDVRMVEPGTGAGFTIKTFQGLLIVEQLLPHQLHRHHALQGRIPGTIDRAHAARTDDAPQLELPDHHGHHDGMPALAARHRAQRRQVARNEDLRLAPPACDHP